MIGMRLDEDLEEALESLLARFGDGEYVVKHMVSLIDGRLKAEVRANEHPPPHFHVTYNGEDASYRIDNCERLPGVHGLERFDKPIQFWWMKNREKVIAKWNSTRPSDCPVGPIVLAS